MSPKEHEQKYKPVREIRLKGQVRNGKIESAKEGKTLWDMLEWKDQNERADKSENETKMKDTNQLVLAKKGRLRRYRKLVK